MSSTSSRDWLILVFLSIIWGSSFILIKKTLIAFDPYEMASLRITISMLANIPFFFILVKQKIPWKKLPLIILVGFTGNGIPAFLYAIAQTRVDSAVAGILNSLTPIFTLILGLLFFGVLYNRRHLIGVALGFIGAASLVVFDSQSLKFALNTYSLYILVGTICYGLSGNLLKRYLQDVHPVTVAAIGFSVIGILSAGHLCTTDVAHQVATTTEARWSLLAVTVLSFFGTTVALIVFYRLIQRTTAVFASSVAYLIPIMALCWGLLDGERIFLPQLVGLVLILAGVYALRK